MRILTVQELEDKELESELREALRLIKAHITESGQQSADLHEAVQHIVTVARHYGLLVR
jgi:hypothetical protein